jgi:hypothetical protein
LPVRGCVWPGGFFAVLLGCGRLAGLCWSPCRPCAVARDFGLHTKISGGQRIDLLGARVDQLSTIWRRLVDAGFESGHAYGKAAWTVKSCVGSTWCRYGVQDSVALAIELELPGPVHEDLLQHRLVPRAVSCFPVGLLEGHDTARRRRRGCREREFLSRHLTSRP